MKIFSFIAWQTLIALSLFSFQVFANELDDIVVKEKIIGRKVVHDCNNLKSQICESQLKELLGSNHLLIIRHHMTVMLEHIPDRVNILLDKDNKIIKVGRDGS